MWPNLDTLDQDEANIELDRKFEKIAGDNKISGKDIRFHEIGECEEDEWWRRNAISVMESQGMLLVAKDEDN